MDNLQNEAVGIFDSGIGGLSVLQAIQGLLPHEELIYIADSAHAPYGNKTLQFIRHRSHDLTGYLIERGAKAVVVACNTATAAAVGQLREHFAIPIIAMEPGVKPAIAATKSGIVGVLATQNTLASRQFTTLLHRYAKNVKVVSQPCPGLVEQIEAGEFTTPRTDRLIRDFTRPLLAAGADTLVLGCTHYPLLRRQIEEVVGPAITIIETGRAVALQLQRKLQESRLLSRATQPPPMHYLTSGDTRHFGDLVHAIRGETVEVGALPEQLNNTYTTSNI